MALKGVGMLTAVAVLMRYVLPPVFGIVARSQEMLVLRPFFDAAVQAANQLTGREPEPAV